MNPPARNPSAASPPQVCASCSCDIPPDTRGPLCDNCYRTSSGGRKPPRCTPEERADIEAIADALCVEVPRA